MFSFLRLKRPRLSTSHSVLSESKKARTEVVASIRACVVANRQSEPILRIQILQYIEMLLSRIASGRFRTQHGGIVASKGWVGNAL
jgi:hypothetical protein